MNYVPKMNRRSFIVTAAAAGGGLALGLDIPLGGPQPILAQDGSPEVNAWVVVRPDDTVVIRVARAEMGQGSLTGLVQLVAEELECDWSKVTWETPTPGQNLARKRAWGDYATVGSRAIRQSHEYVRKGGATAREMLKQAAANEWKVPVSEVSAANSVITHKPSGRTTSYGKVATAAAKLEPPNEVKLKDPKDWKIAGKPLKRLDTPDKVTGKQVYSMDVKQPGMLNAAVKESPVFGGKLKSFDAAKVTGMPGVKKVVQSGDAAVAVIADTWWQAKTALEALPIVWDEGPNAKVSSASIAEMLKAGLDAQEAFRRQSAGRREGGDRRRGQEGRGGLRLSVPEPRRHGADERHRALHGGQVRGLDQLAERRRRPCGRQRRRPACRSRSATCTTPSSAAASAGGRAANTSAHAVRIAKEMPGTPIKLIKSREDDTANGVYHPITQCKLIGALDADNNLTGLHMRISGQSILAAVNPHGLQNGRDPATFQGLNAGGPEGAFGYTIPNLLIDHAMRNPHDPAVVLARREQQPERHLRRVLHGRAGARRRAGSARVPAQADDQPSQASRRAQRRGRTGRLGQAGAAGRPSRPRPA